MKNSKTNATPMIVSQFANSLYENNMTFHGFYERLMLIALNTIKFKNLPLTISEKFLKIVLYQNGSILYFRDNLIGDLALPYVGTGTFDIYNQPKKRRAYASNGYHRYLSKNNSVIIYDNYLQIPMKHIIIQFADRLTEIQRAIDTNVKSQKFPTLILSNEEQRLTMINIYKKYDGNEPVIFANKKLNVDDIKVLNTQSPFVADKLRMLLHDTWNEALTYLGVENGNQDKKERLVADEVSSNAGNVEIQRKIRLDSIQEALDVINIKFNQNIQVCYNSELVSKVNTPYWEVNDYGDIYNSNSYGDTESDK